MCTYIFVQIVIYVTTPKVLKSAQVLLKVDDCGKSVCTGSSGTCVILSLLNHL